MTTSRCCLGTLVGGLILFFIGYALYGVLLAGFFEANQGTATGVMREDMSFVALALGQLMWAGVLTMILGWRGATSAADGFAGGATVGGLFFLGFDLTLYATTNISTLTGAFADAVVAALLFGIAGAAITLVIQPKSQAHSP